MSSDKFKAEYGKRLTEINYDASKEIADINNFFDEKINNEKFRDSTGGQETYHIDYGDISEMDLWIELTSKIVDLMKNMGSQLDFNEFKHTLKYTFIKMEPHGILPPHTASFIRAMCSINVPLRGITKIDLYEDHPGRPHRHGKFLVKHHYTSPIILNVNEFHGVENDCDQERMILKVHFPVVQYHQMKKSFDEPVKIFNEPMPWSYDRGTKQRI